MNFLAPAAFLFAAALPVIVVFYLLKRKRVVKLVASTLLWQRYLVESQASAPFQKLRRNWLLLLQLLLLALVVFALARPFFRGKGRSSPLSVVVLDGSASMQSTDEKPNRFEKARSEALQWAEGLRDGEQMMVLLAGATTEVKQSPTSDKAALRRALLSCVAADSPTRLADALKTAGAFTFEKRGEEEVTTGEIHLFSDGAAPDLDEIANRNLPLVYHRVGRSGNNVGIVRLDARPHPEESERRAILANVSNFSTNTVPVDAELSLDGNIVETQALTLAATNSQVVIFSVPQRTNGVFTLRLNPPPGVDDLLTDNQASVVSVLPQPARVRLVSRGNRFLEKALRAGGNTELTISSQLSDAAEDQDVVVLDDVTPAVWPRANVLALHVVSTNWFAAWDVAKVPPIVDWKSGHAVLRFVSFDNVQIAESFAVTLPNWGVSLVDSPATPLVLIGELEHRRIVWVGFDPLQSTWPLRLSFPIFIANVLDWLNPAGTAASQFLVQPGTAFRAPLPRQATSVTLVGPDGKSQPVLFEPGATDVVITDTRRQGIYRVTAGTNETVFCANLMDSNESNIRPREEISISRYEKITATTLKRANLEIWRWVAAVGLLVLLFEWWFYHKRTA